MLLKYGLYSFSGSFKITWARIFKTTHTLGKTSFIAFSLSSSNIDIFRVWFCLALMGIQNTGQESEWAERSGSSFDTMAPVNKNVVCHSSRLRGKAYFFLEIYCRKCVRMCNCKAIYKLILYRLICSIGQNIKNNNSNHTTFWF